MEADVQERKLSQNRIADDYFQWLCEMVGVVRPNCSYYFLIKALYDADFSWFVPNDDNRGLDGLALRERYFVENGWPPVGVIVKAFERPCTVLEMLIGVSLRIYDIMDAPSNQWSKYDWFWKLIENLGLEEYTDEDYITRHGTSRVPYIIDIMLGRQYRRNGEGGLFPLKSAKKDQRKVEIWYQMCGYLVENYYIDGEFM